MRNQQEKQKAIGLEALNNCYVAMRHGESKANSLGVANGDPARGVSGFGLTDLGREQVVDAATAFAESCMPAVGEIAIVSSDFLRTRETAELLGKALGNSIPVRLRAGLRERSFGELEGMKYGELGVLLERMGLEELIDRYGCEPAESVHSRVVGVIRGLEAQNRNKTLIIVSHADPIQILMAAFAGLDVDQHERIVPLNCAEISALSLGMELRFKEEGAK